MKPLKWLKSGDLEMSSENMMLSRDNGKSYSGVVRFTVSFDAEHQPTVKNIGKSKTEVDEEMTKFFLEVRPPEWASRRIKLRFRLDNWQLLVRCMWVAVLTTCSMGFVTAADWPERLTLHEESRSPDGHYGIVVTTSSHVDDGNTTLLPEEGEEFVDYFADLQTHRLLGKIKGFEYVEHENHAHLSAQWTPDSKLCVATYWERYGFASVVVLQPKGDSFTQTDIGRHIRKAIDAMIKKQSRDVDADVYPQFYIEPGPKFAFTPRPATIPNSSKTPRPIMPCFRASSIPYQKNGRRPPRQRLPRKRMSFCKARPRLLAVSRLTLSRQILSKSTPMQEPFAYEEKSFFRSDESKFKYLDERMNDVYKAVHFLLSPAQFQKVKQEQIAWLKQARCYEDPGREIRAYAAKDQGIAGTCLARPKRSRGAMKYSCTFVAIVRVHD